MNSNRRTLIRNSAMLIGGLFVSGKLIGQTVAPTPTATTSPNTTTLPNPSGTNLPNAPGNTGLFQTNYPSVFSNAYNGPSLFNNSYAGQFNTGYSQGLYNSGYSAQFYGNSYSGFSRGQYN